METKQNHIFQLSNFNTDSKKDFLLLKVGFLNFTKMWVTFVRHGE
jgi:hypothetical protein